MSHDDTSATLQQFIQSVSEMPVALSTDTANDQHYEVPAEFFLKTLGPHLKYSSCYWPDDARSLEEAEAEALRRTCETARLSNGQDILELGCGWGSLSLWMAEHYPESNIVSVSNSSSQREFIQQQAAERGLQVSDVVGLFQQNQNWSVNTYVPNDIVHVNRDGNRLAAIAARDAIRRTVSGGDMTN